MIFQDDDLVKSLLMRVGEQLMEVLILHKGGMSKAEAFEESVRRMLDAVKCGENAQTDENVPHGRTAECVNDVLMIAMALLCRPKLLIADELPPL